MGSRQAGRRPERRNRRDQPCALDLELATEALAVLNVPRWRVTRTIAAVTASDAPLTPPAERFLSLPRESFSRPRSTPRLRIGDTSLESRTGGCSALPRRRRIKASQGSARSRERSRMAVLNGASAARVVCQPASLLGSPPTEVQILPPPLSVATSAADATEEPPASPNRGVEGRYNPRAALLAQLVEHLHGKEGVDGSSPSEGFIEQPANFKNCRRPIPLAPDCIASWGQVLGIGLGASRRQTVGP